MSLSGTENAGSCAASFTHIQHVLIPGLKINTQLHSILPFFMYKQENNTHLTLQKAIVKH